MIHGSLFSGIGGFDLAAEWAGWENAFHCEWNEFGQKVLKYYWPNVISYGDIAKTDFSIWRGRIDIISGGFPCQPYSAAGQRKGTEDARHLWPEMLRVIREVSPAWVVGENVLGLTNWSGGLVFEQVQVDLENSGYEVQPFILPACGVNAPHRRDRVWFVAHRKSMGRGWRGSEATGRIGIKDDIRQGFSDNKGFGKSQPTPNPAKSGSKERLETGRRSDNEEIGTGLDDRFERLGNERDVADTEIEQLQRFGGYGKDSEVERNIGAVCANEGNMSQRGAERKLQTWDQFPTQPPICSRNDGVPGGLDGIAFSKWRNESIKAYGNAIVPQVAFQIFKSINQYEEMTNQ